MPQTFSFTAEQLDEFERRGVLRLQGLLSAERVRRAREHVQSRMEALGYWRDGAWRLDDAPRLPWPKRGLKTSHAVGNNHPDVEALIEEPALLAAIDALLEGRSFERAIHKRPQVLFTLPNAGPWALPSGWHADSPRLASGARPGVQLFACLDEVEPRGGGTLVIAGSHRLFTFGRHIHGKAFTRLVREEPFLRELLAAEGARFEADAALPRGAAGELELEVVELAGSGGDAWLIDMRALHAGAPNAAGRPRIMATHRFLRADLMKEVAEAYGWA